MQYTLVLETDTNQYKHKHKNDFFCLAVVEGAIAIRNQKYNQQKNIINRKETKKNAKIREQEKKAQSWSCRTQATPNLVVYRQQPTTIEMYVPVHAYTFVLFV